MKARKRLTREESKEITRLRLIEAAERLFIRKGFDGASVEEISENAGFTRGAFYSNFENKDQIFLAVIDHRAPKNHDEIFRQASGPSELMAAARQWFSGQWRLKDFIALRSEFSRRALRHPAVRKHLSALLKREIETYSAAVGRFVTTADGGTASRPETVVLVLLAVALGLGVLAADTNPESEHMYAEAAALAFDRMTSAELSQLGQIQC